MAYLLDDMVEIGLPKGEEWPVEEAYKIVAKKLLIGNPTVNSADMFQTGVKNILKIPLDKIKTVTIDELSKYGFEIQTLITPFEIEERA